MSRQSTLFDRVRSAVAVCISASRVVSAVEDRRAPRRSDLERLGIDPVAFRAIRTH